MTKLQLATKKAIIEFMRRDRNIDVSGVNHIYPRGYIVAKPGASCIVVALPLKDSDPLIRNLGSNRSCDNSNIIRCFDESLKTGDWCSVAYVTHGSCGESVAVKCV